MYEGHRLRSAAERALDEPRAAVTTLTTPADEQLSQALPRRIAEVADRVRVGPLPNQRHHP